MARWKATYKNWALMTGRSGGDIICPHGVAVDTISVRDFALRWDDPAQPKLTSRDLREWHTENAHWLAKFCENSHCAHLPNQ